MSLPLPGRAAGVAARSIKTLATPLLGPPAGQGVSCCPATVTQRSNRHDSTERHHPTTDLLARLSDPDLRIIDARPLAAYNGWRLEAEPRGGHIPGAGALPSDWLARLDDDDLRALAASHDLGPGTTTVVYGYDDVDAGADRTARRRSASAGLQRLEPGWAGWSADESPPIERLPGYRQLVHPAWLREVLDGGRPEAAPAGRALLFHVNFGVPEEYAEGHLPGRRYLDTNWLENPADWNRRAPDELERRLAALGISDDTTVVLYGRDTEGDAEREVAGPPGRPDRRDAGGADPALRGRRRRPAARRRLRPLGPRGRPARRSIQPSRRRSRRSGSRSRSDRS